MFSEFVGMSVWSQCQV